MDLAPPPPDTDPIRGERSPADRAVESPARDRVVAGVAGLIGERLDVDPLWVRIGFVLLTLVGGVGAVVYVGLWLALTAGGSSDRQWRRVLGGAVLLAVLPLYLGAQGVDMIPTPLALVLLLVGLALALWQPRPVVPAPGVGSAAPGARTPRSDLTAPATELAAGGMATPPADDRQVGVAEPSLPRARTRRERSVLGQATLGVALVVAAVGALVDEANGGRVHPEQWLGAAAVVCGLGLLVGAVLGHARWMIVPALAFAGVGYVGGIAGRLGIDAGELAGTRSITVGDGFVGGSNSEEVLFGKIGVGVVGVPAEQQAVDARVGFGDIDVTRTSDVTVEIRARVDHGSVWLDGVERDDGVFLVGPGDEPDVVIDARVGVGGVHVWAYPDGYFDPRPFPVIEEPALPSGLGTLIPVAELVEATDDGWFVLAGGHAIIDADDRVVFGETYEQQGGVVIQTFEGEFRLLPRGLLMTPFDEVLDLEAIRTELAPATTVEPATDTVPPITTAPGDVTTDSLAPVTSTGTGG